MRGKTAIVGAGLSEFGDVPGWSHLELMAEAVERALADANLNKNDIDEVKKLAKPPMCSVSKPEKHSTFPTGGSLTASKLALP